MGDFFCHDNDGCIPFRTQGQDCQTTTSPGVQYRCLPNLICISNSGFMGAPGKCQMNGGGKRCLLLF